MSLIAIHAKGYAVAAAALLLAAGTACGPAHAQDVITPEVVKGQNQLETFNEFQWGFNRGAAGDTAAAHVLSYAHGLTDFWQIKALLVFERMRGEGTDVTHVAVESTLELLEADKTGGLGLAWFTGVAPAVHDDHTNVLLFGPVMRFGTGPTTLVVNTLLESTFGQNDEGLSFLYGWQVRHEVRKGFSLGIEGYGVYPGIDGMRGPDEHRIGPIAAFDWNLADGRTLTFETGVLFGLTEATPDHALKLKLTYSW